MIDKVLSYDDLLLEFKSVKEENKKLKIDFQNYIDESKQFEKDLIISEEKYRTMIQYSRDPIFIFNPDETYKYVNECFATNVGMTQDYIIGKTPHDVFPFEEAERRIKTVRKVFKTGERELIEVEVIAPTGAKLHFITHADPVKDENNNVLWVTCISKNITERYEKEQSLKDQKQRYMDMFHNNPSICLLINPNNFQIVDANQSACKFYGFRLEEITNLSFTTISTCLESKIIEQMNQIISGNQNHFLCKHKKSNNEIRDVEIYSSSVTNNGEVLVYSIIHDITERVSAEQQIRKLLVAVDQNPASIIITDINGNIDYVNPKFCQLTGYDDHEVIGRNPSILKSSKTEKRLYEELWQTITSGNSWQGEFINKKKNGDLFTENALVAPIFDEKGLILNYIAIKEDITLKKESDFLKKQNEQLLIEKEKAELTERISREYIDEITKAKEKAEESNMLKTAFLNNINHEIRTPINGILGFLSLLKDEGIETDERDEIIDFINNSSKRLVNTVNDIVEISQIQKGQIGITKTNLNLDFLALLLRDQFNSIVLNKDLQLNIINNLPEDIDYLFTDKSKLNSILSYLIDNAVKFTNKGSISILMDKSDDNVIFSIKDTGIGIPKSNFESIFENFMQVDVSQTRRFEGSGLGLTIAKGYIEMLGGKIWLESEIGIGSTFYFNIPIC
jgi:PAS domain S-box-containing protein